MLRFWASGSRSPGFPHSQGPTARLEEETILILNGAALTWRYTGPAGPLSARPCARGVLILYCLVACIPAPSTCASFNSARRHMRWPACLHILDAMHPLHVQSR